MLKAGALIYALIISTLITLTCTAFILTDQLQREKTIQVFKKRQLISDVHSAVNLFLAGEIDNPEGRMNLYDDEQHPVQMQIKSWGVFSVVKAKASWKHLSVEKEALTGGNIFENQGVALYLADQNKALSLAGKTVIEGNCYLPKRGVERAYIEGTSFQGDQLIRGNIKESSNQPPELKKEIKSSMVSLLKGPDVNNDSVRYMAEYAEQDSVVNSFSGRSLFLMVDDPQLLSHKTFVGNIILCSEMPLSIGSATYLDGVILSAPGITVRSGFTGNAQFFAGDSVIAEGNCTFNYPTVFAVHGGMERTKIEMGEHCLFKGVIFNTQERQTRENTPLIRIAENTSIEGQVYNSGMTMLKGEIKGSLFTGGFLLKTASSIYGNHLLNATINYNALSKHYVGVELFDRKVNRKIVRWLN